MHVHKEVGEALVANIHKVVAIGAPFGVDVTNISSCEHVPPCQDQSGGVGGLETAATMGGVGQYMSDSSDLIHKSTLPH